MFSQRRCCHLFHCIFGQFPLYRVTETSFDDDRGRASVSGGAIRLTTAVRRSGSGGGSGGGDGLTPTAQRRNSDGAGGEGGGNSRRLGGPFGQQQRQKWTTAYCQWYNGPGDHGGGGGGGGCGGGCGGCDDVDTGVPQRPLCRHARAAAMTVRTTRSVTAVTWLVACIFILVPISPPGVNAA